MPPKSSQTSSLLHAVFDSARLRDVRDEEMKGIRGMPLYILWYLACKRSLLREPELSVLDGHDAKQFLHERSSLEFFHLEVTAKRSRQEACGILPLNHTGKTQAHAGDFQ